MSMVNLNLSLFLAVEIDLTINFLSKEDHHVVNWWSFVKIQLQDEQGKSVPWYLAIFVIGRLHYHWQTVHERNLSL